MRACIQLLTLAALLAAVLGTDPGKGHLLPFGQQAEPKVPIRIYDAEEVKQLDPQTFWNRHVKTAEPAIFRDAAKRFPAFKLWDDEYLKDTYGDLIIRLEKKNESEYTKGIPHRVTLSRYYQKLQKNGYVISQLPTPMKRDMLGLPLFECGSARDTVTEVNFWLSSGNTHSRFHKDSNNQVNCLLRGTKSWTLIPHSEVDKIPWLLEGGPARQAASLASKLNPYKVDLLKYPQVADVNYAKLDLHGGDCIFLPGTYIHQVVSLPGRSLGVSVLFGGPTALHHTLDLPLQEFNNKSCTEQQLTKPKYVPMKDMFVAWDYPGKGPMTMGLARLDSLKSMLMDTPQFDRGKPMTKKQIVRKAIRMCKDVIEGMDDRMVDGGADDLEATLEVLELIFPDIPRSTWKTKDRGDNMFSVLGVVPKVLARVKKDAEAFVEELDPDNKGITKEQFDLLSHKEVFRGFGAIPPAMFMAELSDEANAGGGDEEDDEEDDEEEDENENENESEEGEEDEEGSEQQSEQRKPTVRDEL